MSESYFTFKIYIENYNKAKHFHGNSLFSNISESNSKFKFEYKKLIYKMLNQSEKKVCCCAREKEEIDKSTKNSDGTIKIRNPHLQFLDQDFLFHLALGNQTHDLRTMFKDVKFVIMSSTENRLKRFAYYIMREIGRKLPTGISLKNMSEYSDRFSMYKVGPILCISHGIGNTSISTVLHEVIKLLFYAKVRDPIFIRIGSSYGIGVNPGSVVVSESVVDGLMRPFLEIPILGQLVQRSSKLDKRLVKDIMSLVGVKEPYETVVGKMMSTNDHYESQARMDGAFCDFNECQSIQFLKFAQLNGVVSLDMHSLAFAAITYYAGIRSAVLSHIMQDRLKLNEKFEFKLHKEGKLRVNSLLARYIKRRLCLIGAIKCPCS